MSEESREQEYQLNMATLERTMEHRDFMMDIWNKMRPDFEGWMKRKLLLDIKDILREAALEKLDGCSDIDKECLMEFAECDIDRFISKIKKL